MASRRIVLLGATGFTGNRVLRDLLAAGEKPTLVGRNSAKMSAAAARLGVELSVVEVDVTSPADLERVFTSDDVVLSTVGPFVKLGLAMVTAAARAGAHYLDSTGEAPFVRRVFDLDSVAAARGATLIPAFGYDYVPGNLAGALALEKAGDRATQVEVGVTSGSVTSWPMMTSSSSEAAPSTLSCYVRTPSAITPSTAPSGSRCLPYGAPVSMSLPSRCPWCDSSA
jgi:short subunit dehydrogenase-like uncharacterized protein